MTQASNNSTLVLPSTKTPIIDRYRRLTASWLPVFRQLLRAVDTNSKTIATHTTDIAAATAAISLEQTTRADADSVLASQISTVEASYQSADAALSASITDEQTARIDADAVIAQSVSSVTTQVDQNTSTVQTVSQSVDGMSGRWSVSLNVNGRATGLVRMDGSATKSDFSILADRFVVYNQTADGNYIFPFTIGAVNGVSTVAINGALIVDGTIAARHIVAGSIGATQIAANSVTASKLSVSDLSSVSADLGEVTAGVIRNASGSSYWNLDTGEFQITAAS